MKIEDLLIAEEIQHLEELKAGKYAQVASLLGALAAQHGGKAADAASIGYKQQAPHALATLATYADPKKLGALPMTISSDELNKGEDEWKRQRDKIKIGRLIPSLKEGHVQRNGAAFSFRGLRLHFYRDHVFYVVQGGPDLSIYKDGVPTPRNDEIYVKDAAARGVPKDIITIISTWLNTPLDKQEALLPRIEAAMNHIIDGWLSQSATKKESKMKMDDLVKEGLRPLNVQQLATISDEALDKAYGYGRSKPGNTFGWQANLKSAEFAKRMIDKGVTDIEKISDAIHQGWNVTAKAFVQNPNQFDDTAQLQAAGKLEAKLQQREKLMKISYGQLPDDEKEKDRVVARALLSAITGQQVSEDSKRMSRAGKGIMKYGKDGMKALAKAGRDGASDEKLDKLRDKYDKYDESLEEKWSQKYKDSINCSNPKGFSQKAHCAGKKKNEGTEPDHEASMAKGQLYNACKNAMALMKMIEDGDNLEGWVAAKITKAADYLNMVHDYMAYDEVSEEKQRLDPKCWKGYRKSGTKMKGGVRVNNCVKVKK